MPMPDTLGENVCSTGSAGGRAAASFGSSATRGRREDQADCIAFRPCSRCPRSADPGAVRRNNHLQLHWYTRARSGGAEMPNIPGNATHIQSFN